MTMRLLLTTAAIIAVPATVASQNATVATVPAPKPAATAPAVAPTPSPQASAEAKKPERTTPAPANRAPIAAKPVVKPAAPAGAARKPLTRQQRAALAQAARTPDPKPAAKGTVPAKAVTAGATAAAAAQAAPVAANAASGEGTANTDAGPRTLGEAAALGTPLPPLPAPPPIRIPGFSGELAQRPSVTGPELWVAQDKAKSWAALARARGIQKQRVRWDYARSLIAQDKGSEAFGVLEVMRQDDPDLALVDAFRIARAAAMTQMGHYGDVVAELSAGLLANNSEACAWRMRALAQSGFAEQAMGQLNCARAAISKRSYQSRKPFALSVARAAVEAANPGLALNWLKDLPDRDSTANLYRARALLAMGQADEARLRFSRVERSGTRQEQMDARLSVIEAKVAGQTIGTKAALAQLDALRFIWRGDYVEERALWLSYRLSRESNDMFGALKTGAVLFRFFDPIRRDPEFLNNLQAQLAGALDENSTMPVDKAAGLYWDYRDLTPSGAQGDYLVSRLSDRLQSAGLYGRAAELLEHQLFARAGELARGPLSAKVGTLYILAGKPERALTAIRKSNSSGFTDDMIQARKRIEAIALSQLGKVEESFAVLQDVPGAQVLRAEILWNRRDWEAFAIEAQAALPSSGSLSDVKQTEILRYAISLAMLGREADLANLRARYAAGFADRATAPVFDLLTGAVGSADPSAVAEAMAAMPAVSPAGDLAELIEAGPMQQEKTAA